MRELVHHMISARNQSHVIRYDLITLLLCKFFIVGFIIKDKGKMFTGFSRNVMLVFPQWEDPPR